MNSRQRVYFTVVSHYASLGYAPTIAEIGRTVGLSSKQSVHRHLETLEEMGLLHREFDGRMPRSWSPVWANEIYII